MSVVYVPITRAVFDLAITLTAFRTYPYLSALYEASVAQRTWNQTFGTDLEFQQYEGFIEVYTEHIEESESTGFVLGKYEYVWHPLDGGEGQGVPKMVIHDTGHFHWPSYGLTAELKPISFDELMYRPDLRAAVQPDLEAERALTIRERFIDALRVKTRNKPSNMPDLKLNKHGGFANAKTQAMFDGYRLFDDERFVMHKRRGDKVYPMGQFIIGTLDNIGAPHFSKAPYRHNTYYGARAEAERLTQHLAKRLAIFRCCDVIHHTKGTE